MITTYNNDTKHSFTETLNEHPFVRWSIIGSFVVLVILSGIILLVSRITGSDLVKRARLPMNVLVGLIFVLMIYDVAFDRSVAPLAEVPSAILGHAGGGST